MVLAVRCAPLARLYYVRFPPVVRPPPYPQPQLRTLLRCCFSPLSSAITVIALVSVFFLCRAVSVGRDLAPERSLDERAEVLSAEQVVERLQSPEGQDAWHSAHLCPQFVNILTVR